MSHSDLFSRYHDLLRKGKHREAWELCLAFSAKCTLDYPPWKFDYESANVDLLAAKAALKAGGFERAFFNAKGALFIFSRRANQPSAPIFGLNACTASFVDEMQEAEEIASDALRHMHEGDVEHVQSASRKIERDCETLLGGGYHAVTWHLAGPFQKWLWRRDVKAAFKKPDLFGKYSPPND